MLRSLLVIREPLLSSAKPAPSGPPKDKGGKLANHPAHKERYLLGFSSATGNRTASGYASDGIAGTRADSARSGRLRTPARLPYPSARATTPPRCVNARCMRLNLSLRSTIPGACALLGRVVSGP